MLVLMPEGFAAMRAALANRLQSCVQSRAGIGARQHRPYDSRSRDGIDRFRAAVDPRASAPVELVLLTLTLGVSILTLALGRTTLLQGVVHLVIFAAYIFLTIVP